MFYVVAMVTTKIASTECTQREKRRESKHITTKKEKKIQQNTKEAKKRGKERNKSYRTKTKGSWPNDNSKSFPITNCFKRKWIKSPN